MVVSAPTIERVSVAELMDIAVDKVPAPYVVVLMVKVLSDGILGYKSVGTPASPGVSVETEYMSLIITVVSVGTTDVPVPVPVAAS